MGNIEVSVITRSAATNFVHPCPFEVHYSTEWHEKIKRDEVDFSKSSTDADLAAHLTHLTKRGIVLKGESIDSVFGTVPWSCFIDSILDDFNWIVADEHVLESPFYSVLNICRVIRTLVEKDESVYSKDEGGEWALLHIPTQYHTIIQTALAVYRSAQTVDETQRRQGGVSWDSKQLFDFRDYAKEEVARLLS